MRLPEKRNNLVGLSWEWLLSQFPTKLSTGQVKGKIDSYNAFIEKVKNNLLNSEFELRYETREKNGFVYELLWSSLTWLSNNFAWLGRDRVSKIKSRHSPLVHILEIVWNVVIEGMTTVETDGNVCARLEITAKNL